MDNGRSALPGPCARRAPSSGRSAGGGGRSSGPQHAQHSVRWPCWGSLRGPRWAWTTSGGRVRGAPGRLHVPAAPRAPGLGSSGKAPDASRPRASHPGSAVDGAQPRGALRGRGRLLLSRDLTVWALVLGPRRPDGTPVRGGAEPHAPCSAALGAAQ